LAETVLLIYFHHPSIIYDCQLLTAFTTALEAEA